MLGTQRTHDSDSLTHSLLRARNTQCTAQGRARLETRQTCVGTAVWVLRLVLRVRRLEAAFLRPSLSVSWWPRERYARFAAGDGAFFFSEGDTVEFPLI